MNFASLADSVCDKQEFRSSSEFMAINPKFRLLLGRLLARQRSDRPGAASQVEGILQKIGAQI